MDRLRDIGYTHVSSDEFHQITLSLVKFEPCVVDNIIFYHYDIPWIRYHGMGYSQIIIKFITSDGYRYSIKPIGGSDGHAERYTRYDINSTLLHPGRDDILLNETQCIAVATFTADSGPLMMNKETLRLMTA